MAYNAIASGSAILTTNADGLKSGLDKAANDVKGWGNKVQGAAGGSGGKGGLLGSLLGGGGGAIAKLGPWGIAAAAGLGAVTVAGKEVIETLGDMAKQGAMAKALGMTSEQFTGIAGIAKSVGTDTKEFVESLVTMGNLGRDAAAGTETASKAFADLGLNADEFNKLRADEQFIQMFDALGKVTDGGKRTNAMMKAFGEDGGKILLPLLGKSGAELKKMADGFAISTEEMKKATAASESVKKLEGSLGKLWRSVAVAAAPLVEGFANFATKAIAFVKPAFDWLQRAWTQVVDLGVLVWDAVSAAVSEVVTWVQELGAELFAWTSSMPTIQEVIVAVFRAAGTAAALAWDTIKMGAGAVAIAVGTMAAGLGSLAKNVPGMEEMGATLERTGAGMADWGSNAVTGWGDSAVQFNTWLDKALQPKAKGKEAGAALAEGVKEEMKGALEPLKLSAAVASGSKEAYSMVVKNQLRGLGSADPQKKQLDELKKGNGLKQKGNKKLDKIEQKLDALEAV